MYSISILQKEKYLIEVKLHDFATNEKRYYNFKYGRANKVQAEFDVLNCAANLIELYNIQNRNILAYKSMSCENMAKVLIIERKALGFNDQLSILTCELFEVE